jgi:TonB family protein
VDGKVVLSVLVDETGKPRNIMFLKPLGSDLDKLALLIVTSDRFNPGTHNGTPVVVAQTVELNMQACEEQTMENQGRTYYQLRLRSQPAQKLGTLPQPPEEAILTSNTNSLYATGNSTPHTAHVGGSVTAPVILISADPHYTPEAKEAWITGKCLVTLIVDQQGMPQNIRITRSLDPGLDQNAMDAVAKYRFKPAMRNGEPVPVLVSIEVNFHLY